MAKILIIDDETDITELYHSTLSSEGFEVLTANSGKDGLNLAINESPDLILLDVLMPVMDGLEVARHLLDDKKTRNIPQMFLTCLVTEKEALDNKTAKYISKSADKNELIKRIKEVLDKKR